MHPATKVTIRSARPEDVERLQHLELDAASLFAGLSGHQFCAALPSRDKEEHALVQRTGIGLVAEAHGTPIGFLLVLPLDGAAHILELAVARRWQGRGVGRLLLDAAERWALQRGFGELTLITFREPPWNAPFYAKIGFEGFVPGAGRFGLLDLLEAEARDGINRAPRLVMRKRLNGPLQPPAGEEQPAR